MNGKWTFRLWIVVGVWWVGCAVPLAASPWDNLISSKSVSADPDKLYPVTESNGPWMVMACSFSGEGAEKQAKELVLELRKRYKLPAYTYKAEFKLGQAPGRTRAKDGCEWRYAKYKNKPKAEVDEVGVLVGNYPTADDPTAQETRHTLKYAKPKCLEVKDDKPTNQTLTGWRLAQQHVYELIGSEKKKLGPMGHAFVTTNPLLPPDYFAPKGIDDAIIALNKGVPYSLLDCPGKYTVQVATFKGKVIIQQNEIRAVEDGKPMESELAAAAQKADSLTRALRMKGYEAYQFHDRYASIVTVGSFNSVGTPRPDGKIEIDPTIHKIIQTFGADGATPELQNALKASGLDKQTMATPVKNFVGIPFDIQPIPVYVPKRPVSTPRRDE
jgi:hypothetical protein